MSYIKFNNTAIREKFIEILKTESRKFDIDVEKILSYIEDTVKLKYIIDEPEDFILFKQCLRELSAIYPKNYYYITGGELGKWFAVEDLATEEDLCRQYGNPITLLKLNKYKNEADIYIKESNNSENILSGRDEWRSKFGGID